MTVLSKLASAQGRNDDQPNKDVGKDLAKVASTRDEYHKVIFTFLIEQLKNCRSKSVPQYAESIRVAVTSDNQGQYLDILDKRYEDLSAAQQKREKKLFESLFYVRTIST